MVALVTGTGLGLLDTSAYQLKGAGVAGNGKLGLANGTATVNLATGNLILQFLDETLSGTGADLQHLRTYNSMGVVSDGDSDRWRWSGEKRIRQEGGSLIRTTGDGHEATYTWNGSSYISSEGDGAIDRISEEGGEWVWTDGSTGASERYSKSNGWISSSRDTSGNGLSYSFDGDRLKYISDLVSGQTLELLYDSSNRLSQLNTRPTPGGATTQQVNYYYDDIGRLSSVVTDLSLDNSISNGDVYSTTYIYEGNSSRIASISQSDGTSISFIYEQTGAEFRIKTVTDQNGTTTFDYGSNYTDVVTGSGHTTRYTYDAQQRVKQIDSMPVNGAIQSIQYDYDTNDNVVLVTDGEGNSITYGYDTNNNLTSEVDDKGNTITRTYENNLLTSETRYASPSKTAPSNPETTYYVYDTAGRLRFTVSPEGRVSENRYNANGLATHSIQYAGGLFKLTAFTETALTNWVNTQDKTKTQLVRFEYDLLGNLSRKQEFPKVDATGEGIPGDAAEYTVYTYSAYGELKNTKTFHKLQAGAYRENLQTSFDYDGMGRQIASFSTSGNTLTKYTEGKITVTNSDSGLELITAYDNLGRILSITSNGSGQSRVTRYYYDDAGREVMRQNSEGGRSYTFYDDAGRVSHKVSAEGSVSAFNYYRNGLIEKEIHYSTPVNTSSWFNESEKKVVQTVVTVPTYGDDRSTTYIYDKANRLESKVEEAGSQDRVTTFQYDGASRLTSTTIGGRVSNYFYDKDGKLKGTMDAERHITEQVYDNVGRLISTIRYKQQLTVAQAGLNWEGIKTAAASGEKLATWYFYDAQGRQVGIVNEQGYLTEKVYDGRAYRGSTGVSTQIHQYLKAIDVSASDTLDQLRDKAGISDKLTNTQTFDTYGRLIKSTDAASGYDLTFYDNAGRIYGTFSTNEDTGRYSWFEINAFGEIKAAALNVGESTNTVAIDQYGTRYEYDLSGRRTAQFGPQGQKTYLFYDREGRLTHTVNALGDVSVSTYNTFGQVKTVRVLTERIDVSNLNGGAVTQQLLDRVQAKLNDTTDKVVKTDFNQLGLVSRLLDGEGKETLYKYNAVGELEYQTLSYGVGGTSTNYFIYDNLGRVTRSYQNYNPMDFSNTLSTGVTYDGFGRVEREENANGQLTYTEYTDNGRTITVKDHLTSPTRKQTSTYDVFGRTLTVTDALNNTTTYKYDDVERSVTITSAENISIKTWKTRSGQTLKVRDANENETSYVYDPAGRLKTITDRNGKTLENIYDKSGRLFETYDGNNNLIRYVYDEADRVLEKVVDPDGINSRTRYEFDGQGRQISVTVGYQTLEASKTSYKFDRNGRVKQIIVDPDNLKLTTTYKYDDAGNTVRVAKGKIGAEDQQVVEYVFDAHGRKTSELVDPSGLKLKTQYFYDKSGNLTRVINANTHSSWFVYNRYNEKTFEINALGQVSGYEYDRDGKVVQKTDYATALAPATIASWISTNVNVVENISVSADASKDRRTIYVQDKDGRNRFSITSTESATWVVTENILDKNGNVIETRRYDKTISAVQVDGIKSDGIIMPSEVQNVLKVKGYSDVRWGDAATSLGNTRRTQYAYDHANRLRFTVNAEGYVTENRYDNAGNVRFKIEYATKLSLSDYSLTTLVNQTVTSSKDRTTEYRYDKANRLVDQLSSTTTVVASNQQEYTGKIKTHTSYNVLGQVTSREEGIIETDSGNIKIDSRVTSYRYDKAGRQTHTILAGWYSATDQRVYKDQNGQADRFQRITEVTYDSVGNAVRNKMRVASNTYVYQYKVYDAAGQERYEIDGLGYVTGKNYDNLGNLTNQTRYSDAVTASVKAGDGYWLMSELNTLTASDSKARTIVHQYDAAGRKSVTFMPTTGNNYVAAANTTQNPADTISLYYSAQGETRYEYNAFGDLVLQRERLDQTRFAETYYYYDLIGRQVKTAKVESNNNGVVRSYGTETQYDGLGNAFRVIEYANLREGALNTIDVPVFASSNKDRVQVLSHDALGRVLTVSQENLVYIEKSGLEWSASQTGTKVTSRSVYNAFGEVIKQYNAQGEADRVSANESLSVEQSNYAVQYDYNRLGQVTKVTEQARQVASTEDDPFRNQQSAARPVTSYVYDIFGNVLSTKINGTSGRGSEITLGSVYDHVGNQIKSINGERDETDFLVDVNGRVIGQRQSVSVNVSESPLDYNHIIERRFKYDNAGRQISTIDLDGTSKTGSRQVYNSFGEIIREERVWGTTANSTLEDAIVSSYDYDSAGRISMKRSSDGYTYYYYDLKGNLTRTVQAGADNNTANARITENVHDLLGRVLIQRLPYSTGTDTGTRVDPKVVQAYDHWGNVLAVTDAANQTTRYTYNHNNQLTSEEGPVTTAYTEEGSQGTGYRVQITRSLSYDLQGNVGVENYVARDAATAAITAQKSKQQYFDRAGNLTQSVDATGKKTDYAYDIHGNKVGMRNGVGTVTVYDYNKNNQVTEQVLLRRAGEKNAYNSFDLGQTAAQEILVSEYRYDEAGRLYAQLGNSGTAEYSRFDALGNIRLKQDIGGKQTSYDYDELGFKKGEATLVQVGGSERYIYGYTTTQTAQEGSEAIYSTRIGPVLSHYNRVTEKPEGRSDVVNVYGSELDYYNRVTEKPEGITDFIYVYGLSSTPDSYYRVTEKPEGRTDLITIYGTEQVWGIADYTITTTKEEGSTEIWGAVPEMKYGYQYGSHPLGASVETVYGVTYTFSDSKPVWGTTTSMVKEYQVVETLPYGISNYTRVTATRDVERISGYNTTITPERGSTEIWSTRDVEYVYGTTQTATAQRGSVAVYDTRNVTYQSGTQVVTNLPYGVTNYTTLYGTRPVEYIDGYKTTTTAERGSTEIWGTRNVEYVYGHTTTYTAERGSVAVYDTRYVTYQSGTTVVSSVPYGTTNYTTIYSTRPVEYINGYKTTTTAERGSSEIWGTRNVEYIYGYTTTSTAQRGSEAIYATRQVTYQSGTQFVTSVPYGVSNYTTVYGTRQVEYIDGYTTTSTSQRGSTAIYENRQVEYIYGYTTTSTSQRGSTAIYGTQTEQYVSGYTTDSYGRQVAVYSTRQVQVITGYNTPIYRMRTEQVVVGYNTPIYKMRDEQYVTGYNIPIYSTRNEQYITGYRTPTYATKPENYFTGTYNTPIYAIRNESYISGYEIPVYATREEQYIKHYNTPIYGTRPESYFTNTYNTPIYKVRDEQYVTGYEIPLYSTREEEYIKHYDTPIYRTQPENYFTGTYNTPIYVTEPEEYLAYQIEVEKEVEVPVITGYYRAYEYLGEGYGPTGEYNTPVYGWVDEVIGYDVPVYSTVLIGYDIPIYKTEVIGYDVPVYVTGMQEYISGYNTPIYQTRFAWVDGWVGNTWKYSKDDYEIGQLEKLTVGNVNTSGTVVSSSYANSYSDFGQLEVETTEGADGSVTYQYWENGLLKSKTDLERYSASESRKIVSGFKYDARGLRTTETNENTDTTMQTLLRIGSVQRNTKSTITTYNNYDELGRLASVRSPQGYFQTDGGRRDSVDLQELSYRYDEWGNRRAIKATYKMPDASSYYTNWELYAYDAEGRTQVADGYLKNGKIVAGVNGGVAYTYDAAGRQFTEERFSYSEDYGRVTHFESRRNTYNDLGLIDTVESSKITRGEGATHRDSGVMGAYTVKEDYDYDDRGYLMKSVVNGRTTESDYRADGQLTSQTVSRSGIKEFETGNYQYTGAGQLKSYEYKYYEATQQDEPKVTNTYKYSYVNTYSGSQVSSITVNTDQEGQRTGDTENIFDHRGRLIHSEITEANPSGSKTGLSHKYFAYNAEDRIIGTQSSKFGVSGLKTQSYFYSNGRSLANIGDEGGNISLVNSQYKGGSAPGTYTVNAGESLNTIAQALYGDSSLWYVIADANALSMGPSDQFSASDIGRSLRVPNTNQTVKNDSTTFKPYNPGEVIGDLTPSPEIIPPPKAGGCGGLAMVIMIVVAVVVTVITAGAAAAAMGAAATAAGGTTAAAIGGAVMAGGSGLALTAGTAAAAMGTVGTAMAAAAVGGFVGSIASQAVGMAMGVTDGISLRSAFASGLAGGLSAGAAGYLSSTGTFGDAVMNGEKAVKIGQGFANTGQAVRQLSTAGMFAQGATSYMSSYAANRTVGLDASFSWSSMAAASVSSGIGPMIGNSVGVGSISNPFIAGGVQGTINGSLNAKLNKQWAGGGSVDYRQVALDAFGNAFANSAANKVGSKIDVGSLADKPVVAPTASVDNNKEVQQSIVQQSVDKAAPIRDAVDSNQKATVANNTQATTAKANNGKATGGIEFDIANYEFDFSSYNLDPDLTATMGEINTIMADLQYRIDMDSMLNHDFDFYTDYGLVKPEVSFADQLRSGDWLGAAQTGIQNFNSFNQKVSSYALGGAEIVGSGIWNSGVGIVGGAGSLPYLYFGVDASVGVQESFNERWSWTPQTEGANAIMNNVLAPVGSWMGGYIDGARDYSESRIGLGGTALLFGTVDAGLQIGGLLTGTKTLQSGFKTATNSVSLSRVTSELQSGLNPVPTEKFDLWTNYLTNRGVKFEIGTPNALSKLETNNAYGLFETKYNWETNTHTPTIYLPENPNASVFYEESLHALDYLRGTPREINLNGIKVDNWELRAKQTILNSPNRLSYEEATLLEQHMKLVKQGKY